jgi:lysozyme family protein
MTPFERAIDFTIPHEGGYNQFPADPGGATKWGISQRQYPGLDIASLTKEAAVAIYKQDYWDECRCDALGGPLAIVMFDTSVNCGVASTVKWLQNCLSVPADGIMGPITLGATTDYTPHQLAGGVLAHRLSRYYSITGRDPSQMQFIRGWTQRVADLLFYIQ